MQHKPPGQGQPSEQSIAWATLMDSPTVRMFESIGAPSWLKTNSLGQIGSRPEPVESHAAYFRRRAGEERLAARKTESGSARQAHDALADLYWRMANALKQPSARRSREVERREAHLDDALDDTFPASDPVAIVIPGRRKRFQ